MALYAYKKRKVKILKTKKIDNIKKPYVVPLVFFVSGISMLGYLAYPYLSYYAAQIFKHDNITKELLSPETKFISYASTINDDSGNYDANVAQSISEINEEIKNNTTIDDVSQEKGKMYLTIYKLGINHVPININTKSNSESDYLPILGNSLAHFAGTSLPGHPGKTFIYGHSSRSLIGSGKSMSSIFTELGNLNLGDEFNIDYNGKNYKYTVFKVKAVNRDDFSVIKGDTKKTVSLMTCIPPGIGSQRLIVEALEEE